LFGTVSCSKCDASEADLTINLNSTLKKVKVALAEAVNNGANHAPSEFEIRMNLTTNWKELLLKQVDSMKVLAHAQPFGIHCVNHFSWSRTHQSTERWVAF
jgi:hypothetical protein